MKKNGKVVKYEDLELGQRYVAYRDGTMIDTRKNKPVKYGSSSSHGYLTCYLRDIHGKYHQLLVHRVIACTYIADTRGMDVHHENHNRHDPKVRNLKVETIHKHRTHHNKGENNATAKFKEKHVHKICKMLEEGVTHKKIAEKMSKELGKHITVDSIDKISNGTNWVEVSSQYNLKKESREIMNEFSDRQVEIARMVAVKGMSYREVADKLGVDIDSKSYVRLCGCIPRYVKNFNNGKYGLFRRQNDTINTMP